MKKFLALALSLVMVLGLAACGSTVTSTDTPSTPAATTTTPSSSGDTASTPAASVSEISLWTYPIGKWGDEATVKTFTDAFEAQTGIKVKVEFLAYGGDGDNKINAAISAGEAPDLVMEGPERLAVQWGAQGHMVDLSDMLDATDKAEIIPSTLDAFTISDGTLTGYPLCMVAHSMVVNLSRFKAAGVDDVLDLTNHTWTTEGFIKAVNELSKTNDNVAAVFCNGQAGDQGTRALVNNLYSGRYIDPAHTAYEWDSAENIKALQLLYDLKGINFDASMSATDEQKYFRQGILDMAFCWNAAAHLNTDDGNEIGKTLTGDDVVFMNFPSDDGKVEAQGGIWGFGIFNNGDQARIDAAKQFIKFVCDSDTTPEAVRQANFFPVRTSAEGVDLSKTFEGDEIMTDYLATIVPNLGDLYSAVTPGFADVRTLWWNMLQEIGGGADIASTTASYNTQATATIG